jgi:hypothetical protein
MSKNNFSTGNIETSETLLPTHQFNFLLIMTMSPTFTPGMGWMIAFIPALAYFVSTRLLLHHQSGLFGVELGIVVSDTIQCYPNSNDTTSESSAASLSECCSFLKNVFYLNSLSSKSCGFVDDPNRPHRISLTLKHALMNVQTTTKQQVNNSLNTNNAAINAIIDMQWIHDEDIGRGYLLYSMGNQIWRWEKGGGPIPIGRTLHLDNAGCRSGLFRSCNNENNNSMTSNVVINRNMIADTTMVGAISIPTMTNSKNKKKKDDEAAMKKSSLTIAEWGEGRIVRLESETGARTPLIIEVPDICALSSPNPNMVRLSQNPKRMLYTPDGDLLVVLNIVCNEDTDVDTKDQQYATTTSIIQLKNAVALTAVPSLRMSRIAHTWTTIRELTNVTTEVPYPSIWFRDNSLEEINGITMSDDNDSLYATARYKDGSIVILAISLLDDDNDEEYDEKPETSTSSLPFDITSTTRVRVIFNITNLFFSTKIVQHLGTAHCQYTIGDIIVSQSGTIFVAVNVAEGTKGSSIILVLESSTKGNSDDLSMASISIDSENDLGIASTITALELGTDGFLYAAVSSMSAGVSIFRIRSKEKRL